MARTDHVHRRPRSPYWFMRFQENGRWREKSTKCANYEAAREFRKRYINDLEAGKLPHEDIRNLPFEQIAHRYLESLGLSLKPSSIRKERYFLVRPIARFGQLKCGKITAVHLQQLQAEMKVAGCKNNYINLVVGAAARALRHAKAWQQIGADVKHLPEENRAIGRAITPKQKQRLFEIAASKEQWTVAYAAALIAANTTMRGCELKALRWRDVDLFERWVTVPDSKTAAGLRRIPLNANAMIGFRTLLERAERLKTAQQSCYVFPACENKGVDGNKPQKTWTTAWRRLTSKAGLAGLRFHDMRHLCITELAERGAPDQTIMALAGHVSQRMLEHYSHIRMDAKREAVDSLLEPRPQQLVRSTRPKPN